jgi:WD40 repeat protein
MAAVSTVCIDRRQTPDDAAFQAWRAKVAQYSGSGHVASLRGVVAQSKLDPPLLPDLALLRFRDDGQYVLAQDETGIVVFTREPFKAKFRIDAPDAKAAKFTPDKKSIVFHYGDLYVSPRVERWSLADGTREDVSDVHVWGGCRQSELAPDGKTLLCVKDGQVYGGLSFLSIGVTYDLRVVDVESGDIIFEKKNFGRTELNIFALVLSSYFNAVNADFSPDSRFMMVSSGADMICLDLQSKALFPLPGEF